MAPRIGRKSAFYETGLFDNPDACSPQSSHSSQIYVSQPVFAAVSARAQRNDHVHASKTSVGSVPGDNAVNRRIRSPSPANDYFSIMYRAGIALLLVAAAIPLVQSRWLSTHNSALPIQGVSGATVPVEARTGVLGEERRRLKSRDDSPTAVCFRWSQQSAIVNGTLYLYGGEASTQSMQTENTWNNDFLTLDLTKSWPIDSPPLTGLPQPSGPPAVALGYLWNSHEALYLYGGEFSWKPPVEPPPFATWEYSIRDQSWTQYSDPVTSSGANAPQNGVSVQRSAEGAGVNIPGLGRGYYFGGHQDGYTTNGWSQSIERVYLQSLLEFTFPGFSNDQVTALDNGQTAGAGGVYRNITVGGLQTQAGFTARADGLLFYIPGFGKQGILIALAGGTNETFTQMNEIDVYDIATSSWYTQSTSGPTPSIRVNPCGVVAAAPDGSSYNVYMFGGQNLLPYGNQTQMQDLWILTIPAFTWIQVDQSDQSVPYGRSGATCNMWDAQMVMVGGYLGEQSLTCETPGIYVLDLSTAQWVQKFTSLSPGTDDSSSSTSPSNEPVGFDSTGTNNPFNQQPAQIPNGLEGSYGYAVPDIVVSVIGGNSGGGATVSQPILTPASGPLATGTAITYTVTNSAGSTVTQTAGANPTSSSSSSSNPSSSSSNKSSSHGTTVAAIVVGVVCGALLILVGYLLFCLYLYRKQLGLYKRHIELAQRQTQPEKGQTLAGLFTQANDSWGNPTSGDEQSRAALLPPHSSGSRDGQQRASSNEGSSRTHGISYDVADRQSVGSGISDLLAEHEPTFVGVMLNPRRSLRVINRD